MSKTIRTDLTLKDLKPGESGVITSVGAQSGPVKRRLVDMGLTPGTRVTVRKVAPLGDPIEVNLRRYELSLRQADAGHIGDYDSCLSYHPVTGCWRPLEGTHPWLGQAGELCTAPELKVEVTCRAEQAEAAIAAVKAVHPYEEPVINAIPLWKTGL